MEAALKHVLTLLGHSTVGVMLVMLLTMMECPAMVCRCMDLTVQYLTKHTCMLAEVDACAEDANCEQGCINVAGSYTCTCNVGYVLNGDGLSCSGMYCMVIMSSMRSYHQL